jgi:hypothetical protein
MRSADSLAILKFMATLFGYGIEHGYTLFHDFGPNSIAREDCNI